MPSLNQILRDHSPLLVIDAASERAQAGILASGVPARWACRREEAGVGLFQCLDDLDADIAALRAFAFCEGPGSILGIRTSAMAVRMWDVLETRPAYSYQSLAVVATALGRAEVSVIADARRGRWHRYAGAGPLERLPTLSLSGELRMPEGFRHWDPPPIGTASTPYNLATLFALNSVAGADLFREAPSPDAFLHQEPDYARWTPQIHRAP